MLNNEFPPLGGGTGTVNQAILQRLIGKSEIEVDLITSALGKRQEEEFLSDNIRINKVPVNNRNIHHSSNKELFTYFIRTLPFALRRHRNYPYDLCFAWSAVPAGAIALVLRFLTGLKYLVRVCGPDIPGFERRYKMAYFPLKPIIRAVWDNAELVVAKCDGEAELIHSVDKRVTTILIPNGVDSEAFKPENPISNEGTLRLLCVGRLIERKGQHHLIEAIKRLVDEGLDVNLELVGTGDAEAADKALAQRLGVAFRIHFTGYVPREQILQHYTAAHVFVLASYNEGMSVATLEAMATGLPVVITSTGGTAELVEEGINGLTFNWADLDTLTAHLRRLASDRSLVRQMGAAARRKAEQFSWETVAERYQEMFMKIGNQT